MALRLPMSGGFESFSNVKDIPFIARHATRTREEACKLLKIPADKPIVLVSFGGYGLPGLETDALAKFKKYTVVTTANLPLGRTRKEMPTAERKGSFISLNEESMYDSGVRYEDLVGAAEVVVTKPGYGIISEGQRLGQKITLLEAGGYTNLERQLSQVEDCISSGGEALVLSAISGDGNINQVNEIRKKGIPVVDLVNGIGTQVDAKILESWYLLGYLACDWVAKKHPAGSGKVSAAWFPGPPGAAWTVAGDQGCLGERELMVVGSHAFRVRHRTRCGLPFDHESVASLARGVGVLRDHGDSGAERHYFDDATDGARGGVVDALRRGSQRGRSCKHRAKHPRPAHIQAEFPAAVDLLHPFDALQRLADQHELVVRLKLDAARIRRRQSTGRSRQLTERGLEVARAEHHAALGAAKVRAHLPPIRGGLNEHGPRSCPCDAQARPARGDAHAAPGELKRNHRMGGNRGDGRRFDAHASQVAIQLLSEELRESGVDALAHFGLVHDESDSAVGADLDEGIEGGIGRNRSCRRRVGRRAPTVRAGKRHR